MLAWVCFGASGSCGVHLNACPFCSHCLQEPAVASIVSRGCPDHFPPLHLQMCPSLCSVPSDLKERILHPLTQWALFGNRVSHVPCILFLVDWLATNSGEPLSTRPHPYPLQPPHSAFNWLLGTRTLVFMLA